MMKPILSFALIFVGLGFSAPLIKGPPSFVVPSQYIIVFKNQTTNILAQNHISKISNFAKESSVKFEVIARWDTVLNGYAAKFGPSILNEILVDPLVDWVEEDQKVNLLEDTSTQNNVEAQAWGLRRIGQKNEFYFEKDTYTYWKSGGAGVDIYIVDTGVYVEHTEFEGRAKWGYTYYEERDCNGHGTVVASIIGGKTFGVAKNANIIAANVFGCGSTAVSILILGVEFVTKNATNRSRPAVTNISFGAPASAALDTAVLNSINTGIYYAIAAGNSNDDSCRWSPARVTAGITVGGTNYTLNEGGPASEARSYFSSYGTCVDIFAPSTSLKGAWITSPTATIIQTGTSFSTAQVTGAIAVRLGHLLAENKPLPTVTEMSNWIQSVASANRLPNPGTGSPNLVLYSPYTD